MNALCTVSAFDSEVLILVYLVQAVPGFAERLNADVTQMSDCDIAVFP